MGGGMTPEEALAAVFQPEKAPTDRDAKIGVHAQVFTLTNNDEDDHAEWDMMTGFNPALATNVAIYQGSTTGQKDGNENCRGTGGAVTGQVDRGCHFISAKSFDKMCGQMKAIKTDGGDDMHSDMVPHNSRTTTEASITTDTPMPWASTRGVSPGRRQLSKRFRGVLLFACRRAPPCQDGARQRAGSQCGECVGCCETST